MAAAVLGCLCDAHRWPHVCSVLCHVGCRLDCLVLVVTHPCFAPLPSTRSQTFDEMQRLGVQPNNHVVSALFAAASFAPCTPPQLERLFAALALLRRCGGTPPKAACPWVVWPVVGYTCVWCGHAAVGQRSCLASRAVAALISCRAAHERGMNTTTRLTPILRCLPRSFGPPNDTVYSALLTLIQRQGIQERTVDVWGALQADGVRLSPHLFSSLFAGEREGWLLMGLLPGVCHAWHEHGVQAWDMGCRHGGCPCQPMPAMPSCRPSSRAITSPSMLRRFTEPCLVQPARRRMPPQRWLR